MNKYRNIKIKVGNEVFDSKKEAGRYADLKMLERCGMISNLQRQVKYELIPAQYDGKKCVERACNYFADFVYTENERTVIEDTKGIKTDVYIIKRKLLLQKYGIKIKEV